MLSLGQLREAAQPGVEALPARLHRDSAPAGDGAAERSFTQRQARILSIGEDTILLYSRRLILETAGYSVESARGDLGTIQQTLLRKFDLILLCHSINEDVVNHIVEASTRIAPQTSLLQISALDNPFQNRAHPALVSADPEALLSAVAGQLANQRERYGNGIRRTG
jgi:hypothetical protein